MESDQVEWPEEELPEEEWPVDPPPSSLDAVYGKGKGKGAKGSKGKGKGKGKDMDAKDKGKCKVAYGKGSGNWVETRTCHNCNLVGHLARDCRKSKVARANDLADTAGVAAAGQLAAAPTGTRTVHRALLKSAPPCLCSLRHLLMLPALCRCTTGTRRSTCCAQRLPRW